MNTLLFISLKGKNYLGVEDGLDGLVILEGGVEGALNDPLALLVLAAGDLTLQLRLHRHLHGSCACKILLTITL
jgi:hypothetical protein